VDANTGEFATAEYIPVSLAERTAPPPEANDSIGLVGWNRIAYQQGHPGSGSPSPGQAATAATRDLGQAVRQAFTATRAGLEAFIHSRRQHLQDVPCTLLGLVMDTTTGEFACGQIGDGAITALHWDGTPHLLLTPPSPGGTGEVYVITQSDWGDRLAVSAAKAAEAARIATLFLMTDGVAEDAIYGPPVDQFRRWSQSIDRELRASHQLAATAIRLLRFLATYEVPGSWDDRTLVAVLANRTVHPEELPPTGASIPTPEPTSSRAGPADADNP